MIVHERGVTVAYEEHRAGAQRTQRTQRKQFVASFPARRLFGGAVLSERCLPAASNAQAGEK
jgi:hypothetical protein